MRSRPVSHASSHIHRRELCAAGYRMATIILAAALVVAGPEQRQSTPAGMEWSRSTRSPGIRTGVGRRAGTDRRPSGDGPFAAAVLLHGCGGMLTPSGAVVSRFHAWAELLHDVGLVVLMVDSFQPSRASGGVTLARNRYRRHSTAPTMLAARLRFCKGKTSSIRRGSR